MYYGFYNNGEKKWFYETSMFQSQRYITKHRIIWFHAKPVCNK